MAQTFPSGNPLEVLRLNAAGTAVEFAPPGSLGAVVARNLWDPPTTPDPRDDEFENAALPGWSFTGGAAAVTPDPYAAIAGGTWRYDCHATRRSWLLLQAGYAAGPQQGGGLHKGVVLGANEVVWARGAPPIRHSGVIARDGEMFLALTHTAAGAPDWNNGWFAYLNFSAGAQTLATWWYAVAGIWTQVGSTTNTSTAGPAIEHVVLHKRGNTCDGWALTSAGARIWLGSANFAAGFVAALDRVSLTAWNATNAAPGSGIAAWDFVRFVASASWLP